MKHGFILFGLFAVLLLFGCTQPGGPSASVPAGTPTPSTVVQATSTPTPVPTQGGECVKPDLKFSDAKVPDMIIYGAKYAFEANLLFDKGSCQGAPTSATIGLYDGKRKLAEMQVPALLASNPIKLDYAPAETRDFNLKFTVSSSAEEEADMANNEYPFTITAKQYGYYSDVTGTDYFEVTSGAIRAQAFEITDPLPVKAIELYVKKLNSDYQSFDVYVDIRPDAVGKPSGVNSITLSSGYSTMPREFEWVKFSTPQKTTMVPGKYWLIVRTLSMNPPLAVHMIKGGVFGKVENSMKSDNLGPFQENWVKHTEGILNFRLSNDEPVPQADYSDSSPKPKPSTDFDPYSAV
ncbi:MAG: hypothetical protein AABX01_04130 [Candidatus Micrarchaeota archaeon]